MASRTEPSACFATAPSASRLCRKPSLSAIVARWTARMSEAIGWKSNRCVRDRIVSRSLYGSVVASTKMTCSGGSSSVLRRALLAARESIWASSRMYTRRAPSAAATVPTFIRISRMSSTLLCDAASSSITSSDVPVVIPSQEWHALHGSPSLALSGQLRDLARRRADVVFPVPLGPLKRYA